MKHLWLIEAECGVQYVKSLKIKASNAHEGVYSSARPDFMEIKAQRMGIAQAVGQLNKPTGVQKAEIAARAAKGTGIGNCSEHAAIAFEYLKTTRGVTGMAMMAFPKLDHVFVLVGIVKQPTEDKVFFNNAPASWGPNAAICDPWYSAAYSAIPDWKFMRQTLNKIQHDKNPQPQFDNKEAGGAGFQMPQAIKNTDSVELWCVAYLPPANLGQLNVAHQH